MKRVHLIGIGGIGMSGIARLLLDRGVSVSGTDSSDGPIIEQLKSRGARIRIGHSAQALRDADTVVYSSSISPANPELAAAREKGLTVLHRARMVRRLVKELKTIAVTGAHGKSTTTALAAQLLVAAGWDPTVLLGAQIDSLGGNARTGKGAYAVIEADESDGSFLWYDPFAAVITNLDEEHLDYYRNLAEIKKAYSLFIDRIKPGGFLVACADDPHLAGLVRKTRKPAITYGFSKKADVTAGDLESGPGWSSFRCLVRGKEQGCVRLSVPGLHNALNSLAVFALADRLKIDFSYAVRAVENFKGTKRRFQIQGEPGGVMVVEDYAHHPAEIKATLQAARQWKGRRIRVVFQPHRYSRTLHLLDRFGSCFDQADELILLPIYAASEEPIDGVTSGSVLKQVRANGGPRVCLKEPQEALEYFEETARSGDMVLFLGAGSVGSLSTRLVRALAAGPGKKELVESAA
ncbi:MAG: UDP-N-acetylmuramate--L-alanine ligase [Candidatus Omnitrophica bacterium]|nr:UDP-N-acetylmuramate--L-alanine ligase [Candidatus Omnitrophota bacterium]